MDETQPVLIDIKDVMFFVLKKIKIVVILSLVFCLLGLMIAWFKNTVTVESNNVIDISSRLPGETDESYNNRCNKVNQAVRVMETIESLSSQAQIQYEYFNNSILMQLDPLNTAISDAQIAIVSDSEVSGVPYALCLAYENEIHNGNYINDIASSLDCESRYISELITISFPGISDENEHVDVPDVNSSVVVINVEVVGESTEMAETIMSFLIEDVISYCDLLNSNDSVAHSIDVIGQQTSVSYSDSVREAQLKASTNNYDIQQRIHNQNTVLDALAKQLGFSDRNGLYTPAEATVNTSVSKPYFEYGVVGFLLGTVLAVVVIFAIYVWGRKIMTQTQFFSVFTCIDKIGVCKPESDKSSIVKFFDMKTGDNSNLSTENIDKLVSNNCRNLTSDMAKVLITGTVDSEAVKKKIEELDLGGDVKLDMFSNPDILAKAASYDGIVLVEQRGVSDKKRVKDQINLLMNTGKRIVGAIIL